MPSAILYFMVRPQENPGTSALPVASRALEDLATAASLLQAVEAPENRKEVGIWTNGSSAKGEKCAVANKPAPLTFTGERRFYSRVRSDERL